MESSILSFCTVTYNNEEQIRALIENIEKSIPHGVSTTIFVVDNKSSDKTVETVLQCQTSFSNIKLIQPESNNGFGAGNNEVLPYLNSKYHVLVNPDISISSSEEIEKMMNYMNEHQEVGLLSPLILNSDGTIQKLYKRNPTVLDLGLRFISPNILKKRQNWYVHEESGYNHIGEIEHASGAFMLFRTETFKKIGGFDKRYFMYMEDDDITRKVNKISKAMFFPNAKVVHVWQRKSYKKIKYTLMEIKSMVKYFNKWGWKIW